MVVMMAACASETTAMELLSGRTRVGVAMAAVIADDTARTNDTACTAYTDWGTSGTGHPRCVDIGAMVNEEFDDFY